MPRILIVDDEPDVREFLKAALRPAGFEVLEATHGRAALKLLAKDPVDLVLLDWVLPDLSGEDICAQIRNRSTVRGVPILIMTGYVAPGMPARGLDSGADDCITKPFELVELMARIRALLRRPRVYISGDPVIQRGRLTIHVAEHRVLFNRRPVRELSPKEFELLLQLAQHAPNVLDKETLAKKVWGVPLGQLHQRTLDVHIQRIRKKLGGSAAQSLKTIPAIGYQWRDPT